MKKVLNFLVTVLAICEVLYLEIFKNRIWGWAIVLILFIIFGVLKNRAKAKEIRYHLGLSIALLLSIVVANFISSPKEQRVPVQNGAVEYTEKVNTNYGDVIGVYNKEHSVEIFAGIPYAKPPVGELRWKEPQKANNWDEPLVCEYFAPMAMQKRSNPIYAFGSRIVGYNEIPISLYDNYIEAMSEDCLYLNIWKPEDAKPGDNLPVLFYIHGGSLNSGQSYFSEYNGESYAKKGIIVVNISYRLGVFGYLADEELASESVNSTTGNYGLLDQIAALQWVNDNIENFGGDAGNITIAGESAGASSVNAICVSPLAKGLFRRAIAESSGITAKVPYHTFRTIQQAYDISKNIKDEFNCSSIEELREIEASKLVNTKYKNNEMTVDGYAIVEQPYLTYIANRNNEEAILGGYNKDEADVFLMFNDMPKLQDYAKFLKPIAGECSQELAQIWPALDDKDAKNKYLELVGLAWFGYSHYTWSELMTKENRPAYLYYFTKSNKALSAWHSGELPYFYGNIPQNGNFDDSDVELSNTIQEYIINYVKTGNPNGDGLVEWKMYNDSPNEVLEFGETVEMKANKYIKVFEFFNKYMEIISK